MIIGLKYVKEERVYHPTSSMRKKKEYIGFGGKNGNSSEELKPIVKSCSQS